MDSALVCVCSCGDLWHPSHAAGGVLQRLTRMPRMAHNPDLLRFLGVLDATGGASPGTQTQDASLGVLYELVC